MLERLATARSTGLDPQTFERRPDTCMEPATHSMVSSPSQRSPIPSSRTNGLRAEPGQPGPGRNDLPDPPRTSARGQAPSFSYGVADVLRLVVTRQTGATSRACPLSGRSGPRPWGANGQVPRGQDGPGWRSKMPESRPELRPDIAVVSRGTKWLGWSPWD